MNILVVEPDSKSKRIITSTLGREGHQVFSLNTLEAAKNLLVNGNRIDIAILAYSEEKNGKDIVDFTFELKEDLGLPSVLIVESTTPKNHAAEHQVIKKPVHSDNLLAAISQFTPVTL